MNRTQTAILFFTRSAHEEADVKVFDSCLGRKGNTRIASRLIQHIRKTASKSGCDVHLHGSDKQVGDSFGERLNHAFSSLFSRGYDNVIAIGNDSPRLTSDVLNQAISQLESGTQVLGPSTDGGAYLIGLSASYFNTISFINLPWKSNRLFDALYKELQLAGAVVYQADMLQDIDDTGDFHRLLSTGISDIHFLQLHIALQSIVASFKRTFFEHTGCQMYWLISAGSLQLRAPPIYHQAA
mgnify:CR=1 FL=1